MLTRSLTHRCKRVISSTGCSMGISMRDTTLTTQIVRGDRRSRTSTKELFRWHIEWILLKDAANDDDWMRPHDVDHRVAAESAQVVGANHRIVVTIPQIVDARLEFDELVDVRRRSAAQSMRQTMRLSGNPWFALRRRVARIPAASDLDRSGRREGTRPCSSESRAGRLAERRPYRSRPPPGAADDLHAGSG